MFKLISQSRKKGLLKSSFNIALLFAQFAVTTIAAVVLIVSAVSAEASLKFRYTTTYGAYDQGDWLRVSLIILFGVTMLVINVIVAHRLLSLKKPNLITAMLVVGVFQAAVIFVLALQYAVYARF